MTTDAALALAIKFHETYERLAPSFGYETRKETRAFDPTTPNGRLMVAVCKELMGHPASASVEVAGGVPRNAGEIDFTLSVYAPRDGLWAITSSVPGLFLAGADLRELLDDVPLSVNTLRRLNGDERLSAAPPPSAATWCGTSDPQILAALKRAKKMIGPHSLCSDAEGYAMLEAAIETAERQSWDVGRTSKSEPAAGTGENDADNASRRRHQQRNGGAQAMSQHPKDELLKRAEKWCESLASAGPRYATQRGLIRDLAAALREQQGVAQYLPPSDDNERR